MFRLIGGGYYPPTEAELRARVERAIRRSFRPDGFGRQLIAIQAAPSRARKLRSVRAPTLVLHGTHDPLVPLAGGEDTAANIPGARLRVIPGMGHSLINSHLHRLMILQQDSPTHGERNETAVERSSRRFVHAVLIEGMTCRAAGERFAVSHSAVIKIVRQFVETDAIDPQKVGGSRKPALVKCYDMVRAIVDETPDLTLAQIADEIVARGGPKVGKSTVDRTLARLDLKIQKKA